MSYEELLKAYETLTEKCSNLEKEIEDKNLKIEILTEHLAKKNKMIFGQKSEKNKYIADGQLAFDGFFNEAEAESDLSQPEPTAEPEKKKSKKTGEHRGRNAIRADLQTKTVVYELPENERICEICGDTLVPYAKEYITTRLVTIPEQIYKIEYYRTVYKCKNCDNNAEKSNIVKAPDNTPAPVIKKGLPDASMVADVMQRKYQLGEPLYRQEQYWKLRGIYLNRTSLANWVIKGARWFDPVIKRYWRHAYLEPVLNADETPVRVLKKAGKPIKKKGQMWIVCTGAAASKKIALYTYRDSRSKAVAEELLNGYKGIVQTDGLQSYGSGEYQNPGCWAHARRKFVDCIPKGNTTCASAQIVAMMNAAFAWEGKAREEKYSKEQILEMRQQKVKPIIEKVYEKIGKLTPGQGTALAGAVTYAQNQKEKLLLFLENPEIEMTNNLAERTVKPFVINRKNFLFCDTDKGADASAAVMSVVETAKRNKLDVFGYLRYLLTVLPQWGEEPTDEQLDSVMPWSLALPDYCRQTYSQIK